MAENMLSNRLGRVYGSYLKNSWCCVVLPILSSFTQDKCCTMQWRCGGYYCVLGLVKDNTRLLWRSGESMMAVALQGAPVTTHNWRFVLILSINKRNTDE